MAGIGRAACSRGGNLTGILDIRRAAATLAGVANRTPVLTSRSLDNLTGARVFIKAEPFQRTGSFKFRGAYFALSRLNDDQRRRGVVAGSSGNHAQAIALAASLWNSTAKVVMPADAPAAKIEAARGYGADVVNYDRFTQDREAIGGQIALEEGRTLIPSFDHPDIMAGQGTVALELLEEAGPLDLILTSVGGGGLLSGCAVAARALNPDIRVMGVEPEAGDDMRRSLLAGSRVTIPVPRTIADGLTATSPGRHTFEIIKKLVEAVVTVTDAEIVAAMRFAFERLKLVAEPSGVLPLAALLSGKLNTNGRRVGIVISGGNAGGERFAELLGSERSSIPAGSLRQLSNDKNRYAVVS